MVRCHNLTRRYGDPEHGVYAVRDVDLEIRAGEFVAISGASGSGKSTLLHLIGALDEPDEGEVEVAGLHLQRASERQRTRFRRRDLGVVFQFFNLLPTLTVVENVMLPLVMGGTRRSIARDRALQMLKLVGLPQRRSHLASQLSGGEMQRVAIARAVAHGPKLVIADEPTGNLDSSNRDLVLDIFEEIHRHQLTTLIVVTHEEEVAQVASRRLFMTDGELTEGENACNSASQP